MYKLTPWQSAELIWSRFINIHGLPGRNIPADLHQEHLNRVCKEAIRGLGVKQTEKAITRIGKALGTVSPVLDQFDKDNKVPNCSGIRTVPSSEKDIQLIIHQLQRSGVPGRKHSTFPKPRDVLHAKDHSELLQWIMEHM